MILKEWLDMDKSERGTEQRHKNATGQGSNSTDQGRRARAARVGEEGAWAGGEELALRNALRKDPDVGKD